jgi:hypothetical protein
MRTPPIRGIWDANRLYRSVKMLRHPKSGAMNLRDTTPAAKNADNDD